MGNFYLDECGNTGLKDVKQPYLIYGGPYVDVRKWRSLVDDFTDVQQKYYSKIFNRIEEIKNPAKIGKTAAEIEFLENFHFHASDIINRRGLWSKLKKKEYEALQLLEDLIDIMNKNKIDFFAGAINKANVYGNPKDKPEYKKLLNLFFQHVDAHIESCECTVIWDEGNNHDYSLILAALKQPHLKNCIPELITAKQLPMLQLADAGLWIIQRYLKLKPSQNDDFSKRIRELYSKLSLNLKLLKI